MWIEAGLARQVEAFWATQPAGPEHFPRELIQAALIALPVTIHLLPTLSVKSVSRWFQARGIDQQLFDYPDRLLRGCLLAHAGHGFVLVDGSDSADERRFTVAHEIAHFMVDYLEPRKRAIAALGDNIMPVLDSMRPPTQAERLDSILSTVPLGFHLDMMERTDSGGYAASTTLVAESRADRLALELLAPAADVWPTLMSLYQGGEVKPAGIGRAGGAGSYSALESAAVEVLCRQFGLPRVQAQWYARRLLEEGGYRPGVRDWLQLD